MFSFSETLSDPSFFANDFQSARRAWISACAGLEASNSHTVSLAEFPHESPGPGGSSLGTDTLWAGPAQAGTVLVLICGTHGVEGFIGSAIQRAAVLSISSGAMNLPEDTALLCIHALNPFGFAWCRRGDEQGVDLNRNFVDFSNPPQPHPDYAKVRPWLSEVDAQARRTGLARLRQELGDMRYEMALSGGQYVDPDAPFYGGTRASHGRRVIEDVLEKFELSQRDLLVLDLHSGLGPWGHGELICDHPADSAGVSVARKLYGPAVALPESGDSFSVPKLGLLDYCWHAIMSERSCFLTLEFGSYGTDALFDCLIAEHVANGMGDPQQWLGSPAQRVLQEHFYPRDGYWRSLVVYRALQLIHQGLTGLIDE